ncbi:energy-coupling factor transporter transmembrane component T family protein [Nocardiopsis baichengensis]|uniref:energy-coupling factor transporter transmembrane component T family protein n=1 Tax=Nocardiopsis baichengensis TaxID=280240 RepID=UPI000349BB8F|nr:energy-coupling factor transporter transmembrane component T [Nocardiopsis baichengensis]
MSTRREALTVEWVKLELLRTAYATRGGMLARRDPRFVIGWYLVFAVVPWLTHNITVLLGLFAVCAAAVVLSRVGPLVLGLFLLGFVLESLYVLFAAWFFDGDAATALALAELTLKLATVSLASMAAFVSLDPERLSDALLSLHAPAMLSFGVSYGFRMLPVLMEEFHTVVDGYRLRAAPPGPRGVLGWRVVVRTGTTVVNAFYPLILNTAKRTRTTVEALETKGFTYASEHPDGRRIRLAYLAADRWDVLLIAVTLALVAACFGLGHHWPLYGTAG